MTPKEKALELVNKYYGYYTVHMSIAKKCALIVVDEVMQKTLWDKGEQRFWAEVKQEIENL